MQITYLIDFRRRFSCSTKCVLWPVFQARVFPSRKGRGLVAETERFLYSSRESCFLLGTWGFSRIIHALLSIVSPAQRPKFPRDAVWAVGNFPWGGEERDHLGLRTADLPRLLLSGSSANGRQKQETSPVFPWFSSLFHVRTYVLITRRS